MDCAEIHRAFVSGGVPSGPSVDAHLRGCLHCQELIRDGAALGRGLSYAALHDMKASAEQLVATEALIAEERGARAFLRSRSTRVRWASCLILPALLLIGELARRRLPLAELGAARILIGLLLLGWFGVIAYGALRPLPIERRAARVRSILALVAWCLPCVLWFAPEAPLPVQELSHSDFALRSLTCFGYGSALAAPSFGLIWAFDRNGRVPYRVWALAAGLVAVLSSLILLVHCPDTRRAHLMAGHFSIGLLWFAAVSIVSCWRDSARWN